jgi:CHAT domain-containing protein/tetratricopeptide (TPR) repeat protein
MRPLPTPALSAAAALACVLLACSAPRAQTGPPPLASRLVERIAAGDADSARALVRADRGGVPDALESLLGDRTEHLLGQRPDSAAALLAIARSIAAHYAAEFADSFCARLVLFYESRPRERLAADAAGWRRYREVLALNAKSRWQEARVALPDLRRLANDSGDPYLEEWVEHLAGACLFRTGANDEAREAFERAMHAARRVGDSLGEVRALARIGRTHMAADRHDEAGRTLRAALEAARRLRDPDLIARLLNEVGFASMQTGDLDSAMVSFEEALGLARARAQGALESEILGNMGYVLEQRGEYERALANQEEALRIAREAGSGNKGQELAARIHMGVICGEMEQFSRGIAILREALPIAEETGIVEASTIIRRTLGEYYRALGMPEEALRNFEEILPAVRALGSPTHEGDTYRTIGLVQMDLGRPREALAAFETAVKVVRGRGITFLYAQALVDLGNACRANGDVARAEACFREAGVLADSLGNPLLLAALARSLGDLEAARGGRESALAHYDEAVRRGRSIGLTALVREALAGKARLLRQAGDLTGADALLAEAIDIIEAVRGRQTSDEIRVGFLSDKRSVYEARLGVLAEIAAGQGPGGAAEREGFRVAERARARSLLDAVSGARVDPGEEVDPELRARERRLSARLGAAQTALSEAVSAETWDAALVDSLEREREGAGRAYRAALEEIAVRSPTYAALAGHRDPLGVDDVRARVLRKDQALLEYFVGDAESFLFLVTGERFRLVRIPAGADTLAARVAALRAALLAAEGTPSAEPQALLDAAQGLHALLIAPVARDLPDGARLLVVPDGPLFSLPFVALHDGARFLVEEHAISSAPSASVLDPAIERPRPRRDRALLAAGNPATFRGGVLLAQSRGAEHWRLGELAFAEDEVKRIAGRFRRATTLTGESATEEAVKAALAGATHVHLATHGLLDEVEPILSGLALAQDDDPKEDGFLQAHEILELRIPAELVVLSACNTGLGRLAGGEGVIGLTRAFQYAGARAVLISLWEVGDRSTADLMERFYRAHLDAGLTADAALREAQLASIAAGRPPREWAPFALVGRADPPVAGSGVTPARAAITALVVGALLVGAILVAGRRAALRPASRADR